MDCLFCKIVAGEIPSTQCFENDRVLAFDDINAKAPIHKLIIPKKHIATINDMQEEDTALVGELFWVAKQLAKEFEIDEPGYRTIMNCNQEGGQEVFHIHLHLLGGRPLGRMLA